MSRKKLVAIVFGMLFALVAATSATAQGRSFVSNMVGANVDAPSDPAPICRVDRRSRQRGRGRPKRLSEG